MEPLLADSESPDHDSLSESNMTVERNTQLELADEIGSLATSSQVQHNHKSEVTRVVQLSLAFCVIFMPFSAAQNFQTSQTDPVMGSRALSLLYLTFTFANLLSGQIVHLIGLKVSMFLGSLTYSAFVFANIDYDRILVYLSSVVLGFGAAMLWTAQGAFVTRVSNLDDIATGKRPGSSLGYFNGTFFSIFQSNQLFGNLLMAVMFQFNFNNSAIFKICFLLCALGSFLLLFVRSPSIVEKNIPSFASFLKSIPLQFHDHRLMLLVPFILLNGATNSFIIGDVAAFASSNRTRFLVMAVWGGFDAFGSIYFGKLSDRIGRPSVIAIGIASHCVITGLSLFCQQFQAETVWLFGLAAALGCIDAVYNTTTYAILGRLFVQPEPAFANFKLFQSGMIAAAFFYREYTALETRLFIIAVLIFIASVCLLVLRRKARSL